MEGEIDDAMRGFTAGAYPNLSLPVVILNPDPKDDGGSDSGRKPPSKKRSGGKADDLSDAPEWWSKNLHPVPQWGIPPGKGFPEFFSTRDPALKENLTDFPKFKHHNKSVSGLRALCAKYQTLGRCRPSCSYSHVPPGSMPTDKKEEVHARFLKIYS
jgi:hypothetical protein